MNVQIVIPHWLKKENPICAEFCEMINEALQHRPNMSLAEFAEILHNANVSESYIRLRDDVRRQFEEA